jgi:hypothetical protein
MKIVIGSIITGLNKIGNCCPIIFKYAVRRNTDYRIYWCIYKNGENNEKDKY